MSAKPSTGAPAAARPNGNGQEGLEDLLRLASRAYSARDYGQCRTLLAKARKVTVLTGEASFTSATTVVVKGEKGATEATAKNIVIATGSAPVELPFLKFDGKSVVSSDHAIAFPEVPKKPCKSSVRRPESSR